MSTDFGSVKGTQTDSGDAEMHITRYYGGQENGACIQLTIGSKYIGLTESEAIKLTGIISEAFKILPLPDRLAEIESRLSALETAREEQVDPKYYAAMFEEGLKLNAQLEPKPATPQPVRIRPEDMVMVKWSDEKAPRQMEFGEIAFSIPSVKAAFEWLSPIQPVRREWVECLNLDDIVWFCEQNCNGNWITEKTRFGNLRKGDLWQPVLSPDEPAPEGPEVG